MTKLWKAIQELETIGIKLKALYGAYENLELKMEDNPTQDADAINVLWYMNGCFEKEIECLRKQTETIFDEYYAMKTEEARESA